MPLQSLFTNALLSDIHSSHLLQQTIAALQANKFVQVKLINIAYGCLFFKHQHAFIKRLLFNLFKASTWEEEWDGEAKERNKRPLEAATE